VVDFCEDERRGGCFIVDRAVPIGCLSVSAVTLVEQSVDDRGVEDDRRSTFPEGGFRKMQVDIIGYISGPPPDANCRDTWTVGFLNGPGKTPPDHFGFGHPLGLGNSGQVPIKRRIQVHCRLLHTIYGTSYTTQPRYVAFLGHQPMAQNRCVIFAVSGQKVAEVPIFGPLLLRN